MELMFKTNRPKKSIRAGAWNVVDGGYDFRLFKRRQIQRYRNSVQHVLNSARTHDPRIAEMLTEAACEWNAYDASVPFHHWPSLTPLEKSQALIAWILKQKKRTKYKTAEDVLVAGIAGSIHWKVNVQKRHDNYSRAVSCARSVWIILAPIWKTYDRHSGQQHGITQVQRLCITKKVRMRSRYCCQRVEADIMAHAGWFLDEYEAEIMNRITSMESQG